MADLSVILMFDLESNSLSAANTDVFREAGVRVRAQNTRLLLRERHKA